MGALRKHMAPDASPDVVRLTPFTVGDWLVEPKACRISRGDTVVKLRPQLTDLLVCLARRAGEIVLKDEILAEVWPGQYIAESGLSRCVAELRQSLEDHPHEPHFIETFPKRGYRLIAPVVWLERTEGAHLAIEEAVGAGVAGEAAAARTTAPADAERGRRPGIRRRHRLWLSVAAGLLVIGVIGVPLLLRSPATALTERDTVLLADVMNTTRDEVFDETLRLALAVNLEQTPFLRILPREAVRAAVGRTGRSPDERVVGSLALDVCRREGAAVLLGGSIAPLGSRYAVGLEAIACGTGEELGRVLVEADSKERVLDALGNAATLMRKKLGESRDSLSQHDVPLVRATTPSLDALKALTLGDYSRDHARLADALTYYRRATELDPQFAVAWARRGAAARNLNDFSESDQAFRKAYELRDRASDPERFYIMGHYYRAVVANPDKTIETYQLWKQTYPGSVVPPTNLASLYIGVLGRHDAAIAEAREAVKLAPHSSIAYSALIRGLLGAGDVAAAKQALRDASASGAEDLIWHGLAFEVAFLEGDADGMNDHVRWAADNRRATMQMNLYRALAAACMGRFGEARQRFAEASTTAMQIGPPAWHAAVTVSAAEPEAVLGDPRRARAAADAALALDHDPLTLRSAAMAFAWTGDVARARALLDRYEAGPHDGLGLKPAWLAIGRALVEARTEDPAHALERLKPAGPFERGRDFELAPLVIRASIERSAGRPGEAAATFREVLRLRGVSPVSPWGTYARLGLARALRDSGDKVGSIAAYDAFLESWKDADPDAQLLKIARQERTTLSR